MSEIKVNSVVNSTGDNDSGLDLSTNDQVKVKIANAEDFIFKANTLEVQTGSNIDMNGTELILDADADTSITSDTDDQIDFKCGGVDRVIIGADGSFTSQPASGGTIVFNEASNDVDFRIESDGTENMFYVDSGNNNIGISTVPDSNRKLHSKSARTGSFNTMIDMTASSGNIFALDCFFSGQQPDNTSSEFIRCRDTGQVRFKVLSNGNAQNANNVYGAISDIKLKEQITDASSQWEDIKALKVRKYKMKDDVAKGDSDSHWRLGVIAQELETANMNGLVNDNPDLVEDDDGKLVDSGTVTKSVKYSILHMKAVKALQEAMTRIETLEAKVTALEKK